ncbi:MAG: hypothetical protein WCK58_11430, partial [Chloroflexota bacterium]
HGPRDGAKLAVVSRKKRGASTVELVDAGAVRVGDYLHLYEKAQVAYGMPVYGQIVRVAGKTGNRLTLDMPLGLDFDKDPGAARHDMIANVGIEGVKVTRNVKPKKGRTSNVEVTGVCNGYVRNIESAYCQGAHVQVAASRDVVVERVFAHHAFSYGSGGEGYGIELANLTTRCRVSDCRLYHLRHPIQLCYGANHCVVSYNSTIGERAPTCYGDIETHGFSPHNNLFEGNRVWDPRVDGRSNEGLNLSQGLWNVWFRNRCDYFIDVEFPWEWGNLPPFHTARIGNVCDQPRRSPPWENKRPKAAARGVTAFNAVDTPEELAATDTWDAASWIAGQEQWGRSKTGTRLPASLYLKQRSAFLGATKPWPLFGPNAPSGGAWGKDNTLPADDRFQVDHTNKRNPSP